ncbi:MAG: hypothetical protein AABZ31_12360, partial [Bdellovibrionota bacterium]
FTVFFMLTVTLQESLAQAATKLTEAEEMVKKFTDDPSGNFYPQSGAAPASLSGLEAGTVNPDDLAMPNREMSLTKASLDRHSKSNPEKAAQNSNTVKDAMGGSKAESER